MENFSKKVNYGLRPDNHLVMLIAYQYSQLSDVESSTMANIVEKSSAIANLTYKLNVPVILTNTFCNHIETLKDIVKPHLHVCEECVKSDEGWVHLRTCQTCGVTLCCDSSPNQHMTKHYLNSGHPLVISAEPGENWLWCYQHEAFQSY